VDYKVLMYVSTAISKILVYFQDNLRKSHFASFLLAKLYVNVTWVS